MLIYFQIRTGGDYLINISERKKRDRVIISLSSILDLNFAQYDYLIYRKCISINNYTRYTSVLNFNRGVSDTAIVLERITENFLQGRMYA